LIGAGVLGLAWLTLLASVIGLRGWSYEWVGGVLGPLSGRQAGFGMGALLVALACLMLLARGLALRGWLKGDFFALGSIVLVAGLVFVFALYPLGRMLVSVVQTPRGAWAPELLPGRLFTGRLWGTGGVVWNTLMLGALTAATSTLLALAFALI